MSYGMRDEYYNRINGKDIEVGTLVTKSTNHGASYGRVHRLTKTQAIINVVSGEDFTTILKVGNSSQVRQVRVTLDKNYNSGGLEVGTGNSYSRSYWGVTTEEDCRAAQARAEEARKERDRKADERQARWEARVAEAMKVVEAGDIKLIAEQPTNLYSFTFQSAHEGVVTLIVAGTMVKDYDYRTMKEVEVLSVSAASVRCYESGPSFGSISGRKVGSIREGIAEIIAGHYM